MGAWLCFANLLKQPGGCVLHGVVSVLSPGSPLQVLKATDRGKFKPPRSSHSGLQPGALLDSPVLSN